MPEKAQTGPYDGRYDNVMEGEHLIAMRQAIEKLAAGTITKKRYEEVNKWTQWLAGIPPADDIVYPYPDYTGAQGGRVGRQEGGIMDLGGAEKDYRNTGGFVDIGAKEKADDVPARLSVNEFVMTADAVRGAGDGDVEEGAERLQDTMKQLEQKGKRHKAAQGMFATSQRLGEVI